MYNYKYNGKELQETGMTAMDWRNYMNDLGRFASIDKLAELAVDQTSFHFANNNPVSFSDPTGLYTGNPNGNFSTSDPNEIRALMGYFSGGGSLSNVGSYVLGNSTFSKEIPEVVLKGSLFRTFFTGDYFSKDNAFSIFKHLDKHIGSVHTISAWDGDKGFFGNWADSKKWYKQMSYDLINGWYLGAQVVDFDLLGNNWTDPTGNRAYTNIDGTPQYTLENRFEGFMSIIPNGLTAETRLFETSLLKPLSASQFSKTFKGNLARLAPATRGYLNRKLNKVIKFLEGEINNSGFFMDNFQDASKKANEKK